MDHKTRPHDVRRRGPLDAASRESAGVNPRYRVQAIERAVAILNAFSAEEPELGVTELSERLDLHKSTVHRLIVNLKAAGFLERNPQSGRFRLGLRIFELGRLVMQQMSLWDEALPFLEDLVHETGETGHLGVLDGGEAIYVERVETRRALRVPSAIGRAYPAHATNLGKVLLADLAPTRLRALVGHQGLDAYTPSTITTLEEIEAELARVREQGYAVDNEEYDEGLRCIGAPVYDHSGDVVAAIGIGGPVTRVTSERVEELAEVLKRAAAGLSRRLGAQPVRGLSSDRIGSSNHPGRFPGIDAMSVAGKTPRRRLGEHVH